jgi:transcriptional regulator GlxA family with amidase domain
VNNQIKRRFLRTVVAATRLRLRQGRALNVKLIATDTGMNSDYVSKRFGVYTGRRLGDYLRQKKVEKAARMLAVTGLRISAVALACDFSSGAHLRRHFVVIFGKSPREYRRERQRFTLDHQVATEPIPEQV